VDAQDGQIFGNVSIDDGAGMSAPVDSGPGLSDHPLAVAHALARLDSDDARTIEDMCAIAAIAAPTGGEQERAEWFRVSLAAIGLDDVDTDAVGNVLGWWPAPLRPGLPPVVVAAHLDTVFDSDAPLEVVRDGRMLRAPGIADNARGLAALLAIARALASSDWRSTRPLALVATVGEEGAGDLRGAKHFMAQHAASTAAFIALDGAGADRIIHAGVGSRRMRVTFSGPGGHSWSDWGRPNAIHAAARAITALLDIALPERPRTTLTVARTGGGTSINAIPAEAWIELDLRSEAHDPLLRLESAVRNALESATRLEARAADLTCSIELIGDRPAGSTPADAPLVRTAVAATRAIGRTPILTSSSTDANVAMAAAIPAIAIGAGGIAGGTHTPAEWYVNEEGPLGIERALLIVMTAAGL
jgi:tripeptide aminopeptidase